MANQKQPPDVKAHIDASEKEIALFAARMDKFIGRNIGKLLADIEGGKVKAKQAAALLVSLEDEIKKAGLDEMVLKGVRESYGRELQFVRDTLEAIKSSDDPKDEIFTDADKTLVETLVKFKVDDIDATTSQYIGDLREQTMFSVLSGETPDFRGIWDDLGESMTSKLETEFNTSVAAFNRTITISKGKELGFELYEYLGPSDKLTRPFCAHLLEKNPPIYAIKEIEAMDNEQDLDVLIYGGGYNCRHTWRPISAERAEEEGYEIGDSDN